MRSSARLVAFLAAAAAAAASSSLSSSSSSPSTCDGPFVVSPAGVLTDVCGRSRYMRGLNSVWKGFPFYVDPNTFQGGGRSLSHADRLIWQSLGFNAVRLGVLWEGAVPTARGVVNETYLDVMAALSASLYADAGIFTLIDAHQDLFGGAFCADGAPTWAAEEYSQGSAPFPEPVGANGTGCSGGLPWAEYYFTGAVSRAFGTLYNTSKGQQDYGDFWAAIIAAYARNPTGAAGILGFELINEPWAGDLYADPLLMVPGVADNQMLQPFYYNVTARVREAEAAAGLPHRIVYMEPVTWDNFVSAGFTSLPGAEQGLAGLSYHYYSVPDIVGARWQMEARANDSSRLGAVGFLTEFDVNLVGPVNPPYGPTDLRATLDACDATHTGYLGWTWDGFWNGSVLIHDAAREMARPFPSAVAGTSASWTFNASDMASPVFTLTYLHNASVAAAAPTVVFVSTAFWYPAATTQVAVTSNPAGQVTWRLEQANATATATAAAEAAADLEGAPYPPPAPYAYATLYIENAQGASGVSSVEVSVTVGA